MGLSVWSLTINISIPHKVITPYRDSIELISNLESLPPIGSPHFDASSRDWEQYVSMAQRLALTSPQTTESALVQLRNEGTGRGNLLKVMLLLRVAFVCPSNQLDPDSNGGIWSFSAQSKRESINDMNWPVGEAFGHFYLRDTIGGYFGSPYDPVEEFHWMSSHGKWRRF